MRTCFFDRLPLRRHTRSIKWDARPLGTPEEVIPLWVADMDFSAPEAVIRALKDRADHGVFGYTLSDDEVETAVLEWLFEQYAWDIQREWVMLFPGVVCALYMTVTALTKPGDAVIIMPPVYYPFTEAIEKNGRRVVVNPLINLDGDYQIDWKGLEKIVESGVSSLLIFCSPHNPVGRVWKPDELSRLAELMKKFPELHVHSDEVHSDLIMPGYFHTPLAKMLDESTLSRLITSRSVSKTFNLAGLKTATLIVSDPIIRSKLKAQLYLTGAGLPNPFGLTALVAAYRHGRTWLSELIAYLQDNYCFLLDYLTEHLPNWRPVPLQGSYLAWIHIDGLKESVASLAERLRTEAGVWLEAGTTYGPQGEGYLRLNLGTSSALLAEALDRIRTFQNMQ